MPKKDDEVAKRAIIREWDAWEPTHSADAKIMNGYMFYNYLRKERSELLDFKSGDIDKWQIVHRWLVEAHRVKN